MFCAAVYAVAQLSTIAVGVTMDSAAASAASLRRMRFSIAEEKSMPIPVRKMIGMIDSAKMIAVLPLRSPMN